MSKGKTPVIIDDTKSSAPASSHQPGEHWVNENGKTCYKLLHPIDVVFRREGKEVEQTISMVEFRRGNGGDLIAVMNHKNEAEQIKQLFTRLSGSPFAVFENMDLEDVVKVSEVISAFLPQSLVKIGGGS